jgi:hypothetical protein
MDIFLSVQLIYRFFPCLHVETVVDQFHQDLTQVRGVQLTLIMNGDTLMLTLTLTLMVSASGYRSRSYERS